MTETPITRTQEEIADRIREVTEAGEGRDLHGAERSRLLEALEFDIAEQWLTDGHPHTPEAWNAKRYRYREQLLVEIAHKEEEEWEGYLAFAWGKANLCRGNSALRSLSHFLGLIWLLGDDLGEIIESIEEQLLPDGLLYYGKIQLVQISELVGFPWQDFDNNQWKSSPEEDPVPANQVLGR